MFWGEKAAALFVRVLKKKIHYRVTAVREKGDKNTETIGSCGANSPLVYMARAKRNKNSLRVPIDFSRGHAPKEKHFFPCSRKVR